MWNKLLGANHQQAELPRVQLLTLALVRMVVGWHFLYEGVVKLLDPTWSSAAFLAESKWILSDVFRWIALHPPVLKVVDLLNVWGLILIGLGLLLGAFTRLAAISGALLLLLYYIAYPPFIGYSSAGMPLEGNYLFVNKNLVELCALVLLSIFPSAGRLGLDSLIARLWPRKAAADAPVESVAGEAPAVTPAPSQAPDTAAGVTRRDLLSGLAGVPLLGGFVLAVFKKRAWESYEERHLRAAGLDSIDAVTRPTIKVYQFSTLKDLKGKLPYGQIGNLKVSRLLAGGNLIGGWAHARDLIYVSKLVKAYHHDQKVFETLRLAENCGINTLLTNPQLSRVINAYWRKEGGTIQFISDCAYRDDPIAGVKLSLEGGAHACYVQGGIADRLAAEGKLEKVAEALELIRRNGLPAGIGAHHLATVQRCVDFGLRPDFWVKTLHHCDYWSAKPTEEHDNIWCVNPEETITYMNQLEQPWIAFKVLAAGAIAPEEGFPYAFKNGADFICVGMYDFQIVDDVNIALNVLNGPLDRQRPWRA